MNVNFLTCGRISATFLLLALIFSTNTILKAQSNGLPFSDLELNTLDDFDAPSENWELAGDVFMDLFTRHDVQPESGSGVLVNTNQGDSPQDIFTKWEHGDLDLELEFMMASESNSGIYFQGRYELQMLDSWGVQNPKFYDMGGVYQWLEDGEGVGGIAPRTNASRAPGLWQHLEMKFRAPRFDEDGNKIAHARLEEVKFNGVLIHRNVNLIHPTGGAISNEEAATGPLRFQGDHGPVAFRNIRYKKYGNDPLELSNLGFQYYEGEFESVSDFEEASPVREGSRDQLTLDLLIGSGEFGMIYKGELQIDEPGDYYFDLRSDGGNRLTIDGNVLTEADDENRRWHSDPVTVALSEGTHPIEVAYFRGTRGGQPALGLMVEGPGIKLHGLHDPSALPVSQERIPYLVEPVREPFVMHGFMDMGDRVHTHTAAVGYPAGVNFAFDQNNGSIMKIWKGEFINANTMWVGRGGGNLSLNEDAAINMGGDPSLAYLRGDQAAWPDSLQQGIDYRFNSYRFDDNGHLTFNYQLDHVKVKEQITPENDGRELKRSMTFRKNGSGDDLFFRVAKGESIKWLPNNLYQVDGKTFFIKMDRETRSKAWIRNTGSGQELVIPVSDSDEFSLNYSYVW